MKLSQVIALETDCKQRNYAEITKTHKASQKAELYAGSTATYECTREGEETHPVKRVKVRMVATDALEDMAGKWVEWLDLTAAKDFGNATEGARADVVIDGVKLVDQAPVPFLLWLEKQITDWRKAVSVIPTLDEAEDWVYDEGLGMHRTKDPVITTKTKKVQEPIVLYPHSKEHPAQTQVITKDVVVGHWTGTKFSGALPASQKKTLLARANKMLAAVKVAREEANHSKVSTQNIGQGVFDFLLGANEAS
jgi:hypothetical protein